jgi:hypothetical protein
MLNVLNHCAEYHVLFTVVHLSGAPVLISSTLARPFESAFVDSQSSPVGALAAEQEQSANVDCEGASRWAFSFSAASSLERKGAFYWEWD